MSEMHMFEVSFKRNTVDEQHRTISIFPPPFPGCSCVAVESKWFGETPKIVEAMFSLARKRAPCVIFIDEVDGTSRRREVFVVVAV